MKLAVFRSRYTGVFVFPLWGWERKLLSLLMWSQLLTCAAENYRFCFSVGLWSTFEKCISQKMYSFTSGVNMSADMIAELDTSKGRPGVYENTRCFAES